MRSDRGFTLIELLIVMAVIGILSAIALPNFSKVQNKAKESNLKSIVHTVQIALESYAVTSGTYPKGDDVTFSTVLSTLKGSGDLRQLPNNPFTGNTFSDDDTAGKVTYVYDSNSGTYTITAFDSSGTTSVLSVSN